MATLAPQPDLPKAGDAARPLWPYVALLIVAVAIVFGPGVRSSFVELGDPALVVDNPWLQRPSLAGLWRFWRRPYDGLYQPVGMSWLWVEAVAARWWRGADRPLDPAVFHLGSVVVHAASAVVVFLLLRRMLANAPAACAGALLFGLHPVQVESVAWVAATPLLVSGLFSLVAIERYVATAHAAARMERATARRSIRWATLALLAALFSHPIAVAVPLVAWVIELAWLRQPDRRYGTLLALWFFLAITATLVTTYQQTERPYAATLPVWTRPLIAAGTLDRYLFNLLVPLRLGLDDGNSSHAMLASDWVYLAWIVPVTLLGLVMWRSTPPACRAAIGIFIASLLPTLGLMPLSTHDVSVVVDRYGYLAMLGPALLLGWVLVRFRCRWIWLAALLFVTVLAGMSVRQSQFWSDSHTLAVHGLKQNPGSPTLANVLARHLENTGQPDETIGLYLQTAERNPNDPLAHRLLGDALRRHEDMEGAQAAYRRALDLWPADIRALNGLGAIAAVQGEPQKALAYFQDAVRYAPHFSPAQRNLGDSRREQNRLDEAVEAYERAWRIAPGDMATLLALARTYRTLGRAEQAAATARSAVSLAPHSAEAHVELGAALAAMGRRDEAVAAYQAALELDPNNCKTHIHLGVELLEGGQSDAAISQLRTALKLCPLDAIAYYHLGRAIGQQGRLDEAIDHFRAATRLDDTLAEAHASLAAALEARGEFDDAIRHYNAAVRLRPRNAAWHNHLGAALFRTGQLESAAQLFEAALRLAPDFADARQNLQVTRRALQEKTAANAALP